MAGRIGNKGYSHFSESAYHNLEKAVQLMGQYLNEQKKVGLQGEELERHNNLIVKYEQELVDLGIQKNEINERHLRNRQADLEYEREQFKEQQKRNREEAKARRERANEQKRTKIMQQWEKDFQLQTSTASKKEIENQQKLNRIRDEAIKKAEDLRLSDQQRQQILDDAIRDYNAERARQQREARREARRENRVLDVANTLFGTTSQDVEAIKDGTYWWKLGVKTFSKAVEEFKRSVKEGIDKNYNTAQETLNKIVAPNSKMGSFNWANGGFNFGGRDYTGYKQINNAIVDQLNEDDLFNNISNTEVMKSVATLTSDRGFGLEQAITKGYQDTVIKYIVPYLDTASEAYDSLELLLPRNVKKYSCY